MADASINHLKRFFDRLMDYHVKNETCYLYYAALELRFAIDRLLVEHNKHLRINSRGNLREVAKKINQNRDKLTPLSLAHNASFLFNPKLFSEIIDTDVMILDHDKISSYLHLSGKPKNMDLFKEQFILNTMMLEIAGRILKYQIPPGDEEMYRFSKVFKKYRKKEISKEEFLKACKEHELNRTLEKY